MKLRCTAALNKQTDRVTVASQMLSTVVVVATTTSGFMHALLARLSLYSRLRFTFATLTPLCPVPVNFAPSLSPGLSIGTTKRRNLILAFLLAVLISRRVRRTC